MGDYKRKKSFGRGDRGERRMYKAVCDECGRKCEVPFKPTSGKPIYCSDCFEKEDDDYGRRDNNRGRRDHYSRRNDDYGRKDSRERRIYKVTCDECGVRCEVPFKPTKGKPIFCDDCFGKNKNNNIDNNSSIVNEEVLEHIQNEFNYMNEKLDRILKILEAKNRKEELEFLRTGDDEVLEDNLEEELEEEIVEDKPKKKVVKKTTKKKKSSKTTAKKTTAKKTATKKPAVKKTTKKAAAKKSTSKTKK